MAFKSVFDRDFKYRSADLTDVRLTFERIRREQRKARRRANAKLATMTAPTSASGRERDETPAP
jgi:hypothetical protein